MFLLTQREKVRDKSAMSMGGGKMSWHPGAMQVCMPGTRSRNMNRAWPAKATASTSQVTDAASEDEASAASEDEPRNTDVVHEDFTGRPNASTDGNTDDVTQNRMKR